MIGKIIKLKNQDLASKLRIMQLILIMVVILLVASAFTGPYNIFFSLILNFIAFLLVFLIVTDYRNTLHNLAQLDIKTNEDKEEDNNELDKPE